MHNSSTISCTRPRRARAIWRWSVSIKSDTKAANFSLLGTLPFSKLSATRARTAVRYLLKVRMPSIVRLRSPCPRDDGAWPAVAPPGGGGRPGLPAGRSELRDGQPALSGPAEPKGTGHPGPPLGSDCGPGPSSCTALGCKIARLFSTCIGAGCRSPSESTSPTCGELLLLSVQGEYNDAAPPVPLAIDEGLMGVPAVLPEDTTEFGVDRRSPRGLTENMCGDFWDSKNVEWAASGKLIPRTAPSGCWIRSSTFSHFGAFLLVSGWVLDRGDPMTPISPFADCLIKGAAAPFAG
mmetsp:Transcript_5649/g.13701  ORF Transcript_5649/g.13701 Transcript_5649/m.13701 type:complete len:294 (-) Transcript_5649:130-1011(-)